MHGLGVPQSDVMSPSSPSQPGGGYLDKGIGMMTSAANVGINTVGSIIGTGSGGLGPNSAIRVKLYVCALGSDAD